MVLVNLKGSLIVCYKNSLEKKNFFRYFIQSVFGYAYAILAYKLRVVWLNKMSMTVFGQASINQIILKKTAEVIFKMQLANTKLPKTL